MAQADYIISNQTFPNTRADINSTLQAIATTNSGTSAPTTQYAGQFWLDTTSSNWVLYIHDGSDDIQFATIDTSANTVNFIDSALASDVVINTSGAITTTGAFTSVGIDDNATSTAITIDSSESVGIGESSPLGKLHVKSADSGVTTPDAGADDLIIESSTDTGMSFLSTDTATIRFNDANGSGDAFYQYRHDDRSTRIVSAGSERMRIDSSGNLLVGRTTPIFDGQSSITGGSPGALAGLGTITLENSQNTTYKHTVGPNASGSFVIYRSTDYAGVYLGWGSTSWSANSDERLKTNLQPITDAVNKIRSLRTVTGRYITDDENISRSFLIAQDVQEVLPEAVDVQNNEEGTLGLAYTDVIPLIIASIKEQQTKIEQLEARITTLENA